jgi:GntR family transcriptional regulator, trigonelline degradation regulator
MSYIERSAAPLRRQVLEHLRDAIVSEFAPGERLVERVLCERFAVSRTVVREALRALEAEGLVEIVPNRGPVVASVSAVDAASLYEVRAVLEALAAKSFAERATAQHCTALTSAMTTIETAHAKGNLSEVLQAKDLYYEILFDGAANEVIRDVLRNVHARIRMLRTISLQVEGRPESMVDELRGITLAAAHHRDPAAAWTLSEQHVWSAAKAAFSQLEKREAEAAG